MLGADESGVLLGFVAESAITDGDVVVLSAVVALLTWYTDLRGKAKGSPMGFQKVSSQQLTLPSPMQQNEFPHSPTGMQDTMLQGLFSCATRWRFSSIPSRARTC